MKKYVVIGDQYQAYYYGDVNTLLAAKRLVNRNVEYWDNWQGWHYPTIYRLEDVEPVNNFYGDGYAPKVGAMPVASRIYGKRWEV